MNIDISQVRDKFAAVLNGSESREAVSKWARAIREADDRGELFATPAADRMRIWHAILFLEGVDLRDSPESYLHNEIDIRREQP
ncbi:MAG TPA: hypothetical protein VMP01_18140 [Pirellulaceae bacterium]|nr:hypothetical protein [Pirellulaceae bacterium]